MRLTSVKGQVSEVDVRADVIMEAPGSHSSSTSPSCFGNPRLSIPLCSRLFMPNLVPPKIPDGERVDFDVSGDCW